jgi:hypothetical protein
MRRIFWGFCINWVLIDPLHYLSSRSPFGLEFAELFVIEKRLPDSASRESRRLADLASGGVDDSPTRQVGESAFECLKEKSASRRVGDSPTRLIRESLTPRLGESESRHGESGSHYSKFLKYSIDFPDFKRLNQPFKRSI